MAHAPGRPPSTDRLDSWKEIAVYLDRDVRTVQRWEKKEKLPVHRPAQGKRGSVWAFRGEIDAWWLTRGDELSGTTPPATDPPATADEGSAERQPTASRRPRPWVALAAVAVLLAAGAWALLRAPEQPSIHALAVLPLANLSGPQDEYLADGLTDAVIADLANIGSLRVISRTSVMAFKGTPRGTPEIARALGVDGLVEGTVARAGDRLRISVRLLAGHSERQLWSGSYERSVRDAPSLQADVARAIAEQVRATLTPAESARLASRPAVDPEAYQLYLQGRYQWARRGESLPRALDLYRAAVAKDPSFAAAYAGLAETYAVMGSNYAPVTEVAALTRQAAQKALDLDPQLASAWSARGMTRLQFDWDWRGAEADLRRALALNPGSGTAHQWYSRCLLAQGRGEEAVAEAEQAVALDPLAPIVHNALAMALCYSRQHERAVRAAEETLRLDPRLSTTRLHLALARLGRGDCVAAMAALEQAGPEANSDYWFRGFLGHVYARCGRPAEARTVLARLPADTQPLPRAIVFAGLGEPDHAFESLDKAWGQRTEALLWLKVQPVFDALRGDPRFDDLLGRVGLPRD